MDHIEYMNEALDEAKIAFTKDEVPIGAIIIRNNQIIARAHNLRETLASPTAHAEMLALEIAAKKLGTWNLSECTLYVSVEPCPMCAGAILQAHVKTVVYALKEPNSGSFGSVIDLSKEKFNYKPEIVTGILEDESKELIQFFFKKRRKQMVKVHALSQEELEAYFAIRVKVFVEEQHVSLDLEYDEYDELDHPKVVHVGAFIDDKMVGAMRLIKSDKVLKVGRLAVLIENRKDGVGSAFLKYADKQAENNGFEILELGAQVYAIPFYEKNGYNAYGDVFLDADIDHIMMNKNVNKR